MRLACTGSADQDQVMGLFHEGGRSQLLDMRLGQRCFRPLELGQIPVNREACRLDLVTQAARLSIGLLCFDETERL